MRRIFLLMAGVACATLLMAQQKADTILVSSFDSIPSEVFQLPDSFQGDTSYNKVYKTPNGIVQMSGSYHVSNGNGANTRTTYYFNTSDSRCCAPASEVTYSKKELKAAEKRQKERQKELAKRKKEHDKKLAQRKKEYDKKVAQARKGQYEYEVPFYQLNGMLPQAVVFSRPAQKATVRIKKNHGTIKW